MYNQGHVRENENENVKKIHFIILKFQRTFNYLSNFSKHFQ